MNSIKLNFTPDIWAAEDTFVFEGNAPPPIFLNASIFVQIISDPASPPEVSVRFFLWIFANRLS